MSGNESKERQMACHKQSRFSARAFHRQTPRRLSGVLRKDSFSECAWTPPRHIDLETESSNTFERSSVGKD
jgi:hypothetical protein